MARNLVADDNRRLTGIIKRVDRREPRLNMACDGEEGQYIAEANSYDLIMVIIMPKRDGFEVCRDLQ
ncbi:MAG: hypothetical protein MUP49_01490 [Dehalococcoidia bacterium]|nr:hypothetical protein [Dehalococcoidia bacterium]